MWWGILGVLVTLAANGGDTDAADWQKVLRIAVYQPVGYACLAPGEEPPRELARLFYKHPLVKVAEQGSRVRVRPDGCDFECLLPRTATEPVHSRPFACPAERAFPGLVPLARLLRSPLPDPPARKPLGKLFPTFYQVALESLYPGPEGDPKVTLRDGRGRRIATVSRTFRTALLRQGTGALSDGRVLNVGRKTEDGRRFIVLPEESFGLGVSGYNLYPYRSAAVDFDYLCDQLPELPGCTAGNLKRRDRKVTRSNRKALAGSLLFLPRLVGVPLPDGTKHDGYLCAVDVGGGIKLGRIDLFVGTDGAGNPYYPACRRSNPLIRAGIESLIPSDWHTFEQDDEGRYRRTVLDEYRTISPHKGLEVFLLVGARCRGQAREAAEAQ